MTNQSELNQLLSFVKYNSSYNHTEGLNPFRRMLDNDADGNVLRFLLKEMSTLQEGEKAGIAFIIAEHYLKKGNLTELQKLYATAEPRIKASILDGLTGEPDANLEIGAGVVKLAIEGARDTHADVRVNACSVLQNQCAWKVDVSEAFEILGELLNDGNSQVQQMAAYAAGNFSKRKYDMSRCIAPLGRNLKVRDNYAYAAAAWALWQLSRHRHDISAAVPELAKLLTDNSDYSEPRKYAAGALLHYSRKSVENCRFVKQCIKSVILDRKRKEIDRFLEQLNVVPS